MNILEILKGFVTPELITKASGLLGENEGAVKKALGGAMPSILASLNSHVEGNTVPAGLFDQLKSADAIAPASVDDLVTGKSTATSGFIDSLLGDKMGGLGELIGKFANVKTAAAGSLVAMAGSFVMNFLGKQVQENGLDLGGLTKMLGENKSMIAGALPAGLDKVFALGSLGSMAAATAATVKTEEKVAAAVAAPVETVRAAAPLASSLEPSSAIKWAWPALGLAGLAGAAAIFMTNLNRPKVEGGDGHGKAATHSAEKVEKSNIITPPEPEKAPEGMVNLSVTDGLMMTVPTTGIEAQLVGFIKDESKPADKTTWFNFDRILFDTAKATLKSESQEQVDNIAKIMKAFPNVQLKIGGYTDNTGNKEANLKLSGDRANAVMAAIVAAGIDATRLKAEGFGDQFPVGDNATEEGRALNRRIACRVAAK
jgi:OmpA-OmpF porin, OOP family